jgi:CRP-like cAMP-binding protein
VNSFFFTDVQTKGPVTCFVLSRDNFMLILGGMDKITQTLAQQMRIRILKSVPLLAMLTDEELIQVRREGREEITKENKQNEEGANTKEKKINCVLSDAIP